MSLKTLQALLEDPQSSQLWVTLPLLEQARYMCSAAAKSLQSCPTLCNPRDSSPLGSPIPGILQARTLEWVAISFSNAWKWKVKVKSLSWVRLLMTPWTAAYQAPPSMGFFQGRVLEWGAIAFSKSPYYTNSNENKIWKIKTYTIHIAMTNLDSVLKSKGITLPTKVHIVKAMVFPVVTCRCESWTVKKAECWRIDAFEL